MENRTQQKMWCDYEIFPIISHLVQEARTQGIEDAAETRTEAVSGSVIQSTVCQRPAGTIIYFIFQNVGNT